LPEDVEAFWMICAEDEFSWEGDPDRCEAAFADAKSRATASGWATREIVFSVPGSQVEAVFAPAEVEASVDSRATP
jgi:hypothetical protein